ncbi:HalOD1 output domain-containing protein [Halorubrum sp. Ea8]|uniref:HalOD1 output domain-containing protein n=1 Tax=Halorubrum sp. Ea8 TaxID=1383841 RepID=UPI000B986DD3|nr:HalOD1 output domain-containing protein [Halorubrum sp. Ea8]OYR52675.1 hypothetical protein DJ74_00880 [Halorubrum sp. Ea8]
MSDTVDDEIVHRELETDRQEPVAQIVEVVAELEGDRQDDLTPGYKQVDHILQHVFSDPPVPEAQVKITFSYEGYRITVEQYGKAQFVKL